MNAIVQSAETKRRNDGLAFFALAKGQRVRAGEYRRWAREAEDAGKLDKYRKYASEAKRSFNDALYHLQTARRYLNG